MSNLGVKLDRINKLLEQVLERLPPGYQPIQTSPQPVELAGELVTVAPKRRGRPPKQ